MGFAPNIVYPSKGPKQLIYMATTNTTTNDKSALLELRV